MSKHPRTERISVRVTPAEKARLRRAAQREHRDLADWLRLLGLWESLRVASKPRERDGAAT